MSALNVAIPRVRVVDHVLDLIGKTPLVRLKRLRELRDAPDVRVYAKLELLNPGGSVKDRAASQMIRDALADGRMSRDKILIDSTSGNTGVAYAMIGAALGIPVELVMPRNVTEPRKQVTRAYGAKLTFSDPMTGSDGAIRKVRELVAANPDKYFYPDQYSNESNPRAHELGTAVELIEDFGAELTHFVAGMGTSGTIMGTTRGLRKGPTRVECVAVEPAEAMHALEGLKHMASAIVPAIYDAGVPDRIQSVTTDDGWAMTERLVAEEGLHLGHSSGANVWAAVEIAKAAIAEGRPACIVTVACDRGDRYFQPMKWDTQSAW
ncbi:MAG: PLP-dependent cysteine synthase family protein [Polyangiales bacterium]